jgi:hypothetical protein
MESLRLEYGNASQPNQLGGVGIRGKINTCCCSICCQQTITAQGLVDGWNLLELRLSKMGTESIL